MSQRADDTTTIPDDVFERLARRVLGVLIKNDERTSVQLSRNTDLAELPADSIDQFFIRSSHLFTRIASSGDVIDVAASMDLKFCSTDGCQNAACPSLHCCKFFVSNNCKFGKKCRLGHDVTANPHNAPLLRRFLLDGMSSDDVVRLLRASARPRPTTVTSLKICKFYNGPKGCRCDQEGKRCPALHVCLHYVIGDCTYGPRCRRSHDVTAPNEVAILRSCGVDVDGQNVEDVLAKLRSVMALNEDVDNCEPASPSTSGGARPESSSAASPNAKTSSSKTMRSASLTASNDKTEKRRQRKKMVCIHHLRGMCRYGDSCQNYHSKFGLKYQWQWSDCGSTGQDADDDQKDWQDFDKEKCITIERNFCDVEKEACSVKDQNGDSIHVDFNDESYVRTQDGDTGRVRRLGTQSADNAEMYNRQRFKTLWIWHRKTSTGLFEKYDVSDDIEQEYQSENSLYVSPGNDFTVDLRSMIHHTVQGFDQFPVRRRPVFFDTSATISASASGSAELRTNIPTSWIFDTTGNCDPDVQLVPVPNSGSTANEYQEIAALFGATMPDPIKSLKRIQNKELWEDFDRMRQRMEKKRSGSGPLCIRRLFHGTRLQYVDAICQQGFDWRVAGMSVGTLYGKGSYFARDIPRITALAATECLLLR